MFQFFVRSVVKKMSALAFMGVFAYLLLDLLLSGMLFIEATDERDKFFLTHYPLAVRSALSPNHALPKLEYSSEFTVDTFEHFSLLGFFRPSYIAIIRNGKKVATLEDVEHFRLEIAKHRALGGKILLALGGSTTATAQMSNWPTPLEQLVRKEDYLVINAGHNGFTSFQERILLFELLFPLLNPNLPDIVVSLTGVNDIARAASSILLREKHELSAQLKPAIVHDSYILNDLKNRAQGSVLSLLKGRMLNSLVLEKYLPSAVAFLTPKNMNEPKPLFEALGMQNGLNLYRFCSLYASVPQSYGAFTPDQIVKDNDLGASMYETFEDLIFRTNALSKKTIDLRLDDCQKERRKVLAEKQYMQLSPGDEASVINELLMNHLQTYSALAVYRIKYLAFLQPISTAEAFPIKDIPKFDYNLVHWYMRGDANGHNYAFEGSKLFQSVSNKITQKPYSDFFYSLHFPKELETSRDVFTSDNIHYTEWFSKYIASEIYKRAQKNLPKQSEFVNHLVSATNGQAQSFCGQNLKYQLGEVTLGAGAKPEYGFSQAMDGNISTMWESTPDLPLQINFEISGEASKAQIKTLGLRTGFSGVDSIDRMPKSWSLRGSNNKEQWIDLLSIESSDASLEGELREYQVVDQGSYRFFELVVDELVNSTILRISELSMQGCIELKDQR